LAAVTFGAMAMLCKEPGITALGVCAAFELAALRDPPPCPATADAGTTGQARRAWKHAAQRIALLGILGIVLVGGRLNLNQGQPRFTRWMNPIRKHPEVLTRAMSYQFLWAQHYWLLLWPATLSVDWAYSAIPPLETALDLRNAATLQFYATIVAAFAGCRAALGTRAACAMAALLVLPFLPMTNLAFPVGFVVAERVMYLPSLGFCMIVASLLIGDYSRSPIRRKAGAALLVAMVAANGGRTWLRNAEWQDCATLWEGSTRALPTNEYLPWARAACAVERGEGEEAQEGYYRRSLAVNPRFDRGLASLGELLHGQVRGSSLL
jgi:hypothetical protein